MARTSSWTLGRIIYKALIKITPCIKNGAMGRNPRATQWRTPLSRVCVAPSPIHMSPKGPILDVRHLPALNATLNTIAAVLLVLAFVAIKRGDVERHKKLMLSATAVSAAFLTSYLIYHFGFGSVPFTHQGTARTVYFAILIPHVILA